MVYLPPGQFPKREKKNNKKTPEASKKHLPSVLFFFLKKNISLLFILIHISFISHAGWPAVVMVTPSTSQCSCFQPHFFYLSQRGRTGGAKLNSLNSLKISTILEKLLRYRAIRIKIIKKKRIVCFAVVPSFQENTTPAFRPAAFWVCGCGCVSLCVCSAVQPFSHDQSTFLKRGHFPFI